MNIFIEYKIKERLKDLADRKESYVVTFVYGDVKVEILEGESAISIALMKEEIADLKEEIKELEEQNSVLEEKLDSIRDAIGF